jgi:hypothetical protein
VIVFPPEPNKAAIPAAFSFGANRSHSFSMRKSKRGGRPLPDPPPPAGEGKDREAIEGEGLSQVEAWKRMSFGELLMSAPIEPGDIPPRNRKPMRRVKF